MNIGFLGDVFPESEWENFDRNVITNLRIGDRKTGPEKTEEDYGVMTRW